MFVFSCFLLLCRVRDSNLGNTVGWVVCVWGLPTIINLRLINPWARPDTVSQMILDLVKLTIEPKQNMEPLKSEILTSKPE